MRPKATAGSLLIKIFLIFFCWFLLFILGQNSKPALTAICLVLLVLLYFWHERLEIIRIITVTIGLPIVEIACTTPSLGLYSYTEKELFTIPYWLPIGWALFTLVTFRVIDDVISILNLEKGVFFLLKNKCLLLFIEIFSLAAGAAGSLLIWKYTGEINTALSLFVLAFLNLILCLVYNRKADIIILTICIIFGTVNEYAGIAGKAWEWTTATDLWGLPLYAPFAYSILMFWFNRFALDIDAIIEERKTKKL